MRGKKQKEPVGMNCAEIFTALAMLEKERNIPQTFMLDKIIQVVTTALVSMPNFVIATLLLIIFALKLKWFPTMATQEGGMILPALSLALYPMSYITRLTRSSMLDVLGQDYIRTAKAKGVSAVKVIFGHALKNALIPVVTYFGPLLS